VVWLAWALVSCSLGASDNSARAECERRADDDPAVLALYTENEGGYTYLRTDRDLIASAKRQAMMRCMRAKGLAPPGGVQGVEPHL
jgi:hypothetical protein